MNIEIKKNQNTTVGSDNSHLVIESLESRLEFLSSENKRLEEQHKKDVLENVECLTKLQAGFEKENWKNILKKTFIKFTSRKFLVSILFIFLIIKQDTRFLIIEHWNLILPVFLSYLGIEGTIDTLNSNKKKDETIN